MQNILILYNGEKDSADYSLFHKCWGQTIQHSIKQITLTFDLPINVEDCVEKYQHVGRITRIFTHSRLEAVQRLFPNVPISPYSSTTPGYGDAKKAIEQSIHHGTDSFVETVAAQFEAIVIKDKRKAWAGYCGRVFDRCMKREDFDQYLDKNFLSLEQDRFWPNSIDVILDFALAQREKTKATESSEIIGQSKEIKAIHDLISRAAKANTSVLVCGESGVGKELVARAIHFGSPRKSKPLVTLNCAAISESLLTSELFGHEKGSFTGATDQKIGKFEDANTGTLFLDEIGEMTPALQSKFLRVLEGHPFERVGGNAPISVNVRVIAATNRDLEKEVTEGRFRHDLFFRLRVLEIVVPPLRKRIDDIPILAQYFLDRYGEETGRRYQGFVPEAMQALTAHRWPGNIRELKNVVERAVVLGDRPFVKEHDLLLSPLEATGGDDDLPKNDKELIEKLVEQNPHVGRCLLRQWVEKLRMFQNAYNNDADRCNWDAAAEHLGYTSGNSITKHRNVIGKKIHESKLAPESLGWLSRTFPDATKKRGQGRIWNL